MSTHIPGKHIDGMVKAFGHTDPSVPAGWTREAWQAYLDDADGGRAPWRVGFDAACVICGDENPTRQDPYGNDLCFRCGEAGMHGSPQSVEQVIPEEML